MAQDCLLASTDDRSLKFGPCIISVPSKVALYIFLFETIEVQTYLKDCVRYLGPLQSPKGHISGGTRS